MSDAPSLRGRRALVTGSTQGIGPAIARGLAASGARLFLHGLARAPDAEALLGDAFAGFSDADIARNGKADALVYVATKAAQTATMRTLAHHHAGSGVTFNTLRPGAIETARNAHRLADPAFRAAVTACIPAGRIGVTEDCAGIAVALCTDACAYVNGAEIPVDGGMGL